MSGKNLAPTFDCVADASFDSGGSAASEEHLCGWEFQCSLDGSSNRAASGSSGPSFYGLQIKNIARSGSSEAPFIWGQIKNISAEFRVNSETEYSIKGHLVYASKYLDSDSKEPKKTVKIPLMTIFTLVLKSVGIAEPAFELVGTNGAYQVNIKIEPRLAPCYLACLAVAHLTVDFCSDYRLAEESAIRNALQYLGNMYNIAVVDLSSHKIACLKVPSNKYAKLVPAIHSLRSLLDAWSHSVSGLYKTKSCPESIDPNNQLYSFVRNAYLCEVDILCLLLERLHLPQPEYLPCANDGMFFGALKLFLPDPNNNDMVHSYLVEAWYPQDELDDANNLTAQEDILFLEKNMNIEIVDFNHSKKLAAEVELQFWKDLMYDCRFLGAAVQKIWEDMLANLNDSVHRAKQSGSCGPLLHVMEMALSQCYVNLEAALERCQKPHV